MIFQHFPSTKVWRCKSDLAVKRSKLILRPSFEQTWLTLSPKCCIPRFSHKAFLVLEKQIFKCFFLPYMGMLVILFNGAERPRWLSWMRRPTGNQEVAGSTPAEVGNILSWRLIMKYFLRSFSPFRWFKKGSCQFLAKECAQYWLTA